MMCGCWETLFVVVPIDCGVLHQAFVFEFVSSSAIILIDDTKFT